MVRSLRGLIVEIDWVLLGSILALLSIGLLMLYSVSLGREGGDFSLFWKQLIVAAVGLVVLFAVSTIHIHVWEGVARWLYLVMFVVLLLVLFFGETVNATRGWLNIAGARVQPVEFAKVVAILALASFFSRHARSLDRFWNLAMSFLIAAGLMLPVLFQPDFGSAAIVFSLWASLLLITGVRREYVIGLMVVGAVGFSLAWAFVFAPYQKERLQTFFFPSDQTAAQSYNVRQAIIAVGSGEFMGRGLGAGSQSQLRFLPEATTDFIVASIGEELGFVGLAVVFALLAVLFFRLFQLLVRSSSWFGSFVVLGTILLVLVEVVMNAGMNFGLFPVVGIPFPFLSAGGSSLLAHFILFGLVESIARFESSRGYRGGGVAVA